ncbi:MAG: tRNA1(Val) (adenine(37)-N6)-methyltransferase [Hyphomicrobiaceae bacterium]
MQPEQRMNPTEVTDDAFLGTALRVLQPKGGYRAGTDSVLLAASVEGTKDQRLTVLDVGAGVGVAGLCAAARLQSAHLTLLELQQDLAELALRNLTRNGLEGRGRVVVGDVRARQSLALIEPDSFDRVISNPPFHDAGKSRPSPSARKAASHTMPDGGLDDWVRFMARAARPGGSATLIHLAERLDDVLKSFQGRFGDICVLPLHPRPNEPAKRIIVSGIKGSRKPLRLLSGMVLHDQGNGFRPEVDRILRQPRALRPCCHGAGDTRSD